MSQLTEAFKAISVINAHEFYPPGSVYISRRYGDGSRAPQHPGWVVNRQGDRTDPEAPWYHYGNKQFGIGFDNDEQNALELAIAWAEEKYGAPAAGWAKDPYGNYADAELIERTIDINLRQVRERAPWAMPLRWMAKAGKHPSATGDMPKLKQALGLPEDATVKALKKRMKERGAEAEEERKLRHHEREKQRSEEYDRKQEAKADKTREVAPKFAGITNRNGEDLAEELLEMFARDRSTTITMSYEAIVQIAERMRD